LHWHKHRLNPGQERTGTFGSWHRREIIVSVEPLCCAGKEAEDNRYSELVAEGAFSKRTLVEVLHRASVCKQKLPWEATAGPTREEIDAQRASVAAAAAKPGSTYT